MSSISSFKALLQEAVSLIQNAWNTIRNAVTSAYNCASGNGCSGRRLKELQSLGDIKAALRELPADVMPADARQTFARLKENWRPQQRRFSGAHER